MSMRVLGTDAEPAFGRQAAAFLIVFSLLIGFLVLPRRMSPFIPAAQAAPPIGLDGGSITSLDTPYTEFFDTLASSGTNLAWTDNVTLKGWYSSRTTYNSGTGSSNTGALYSFGTSAADRALGSVGSGGTGTVYYGVKLTNNTGSPITSLDIGYIAEQWRTGGSSNATPSVAQLVDFQYRVANMGVVTGINAPPADWLDHDPLDFSSPTFGTTVGAALDGNLPANRLSKASTLTVTVSNGQEIWLRWRDVDHPNNDHGLAIDEFSVTAHTSVTTTPPSGSGTATPASVTAGDATILGVAVTPGTNPTSTGLGVTANLSAIGGLASQIFLDDGLNGDSVAGDNIFSYRATVAPGTQAGPKNLAFTVTDAENRSGVGSIAVTVAQAADHLVISQIYGGGGNTNATFQNDYVELYNPTTGEIDTKRWTIQYGSATGNTWTIKQPLGGIIGPGEYYLVALASGGSTGDPLPQANIAGDINMAAAAGKVALVRNGDSLSGACPLADPDIVDFVGYGTTANCREGATNALAPSNSDAIFRKGGGVVDTNVNGSDFVKAAPMPRRTTPIQEIGPSVLSTDPFAGNLVAPKDASIDIDFTEPVTIDADWFDINCASGHHNSVTQSSANNGKKWVITPNVNFVPGEQCTVEVKKDAIHDMDADDAAADTDTLLENYSWSFSVATGAPAPYGPEVHLTMGNPTNAVADANQPNNFLMQKEGYALSYNRDKGTPNWVSWHLDKSWYGSGPRTDAFRPDPAVPSDWYRVQATDYFASGFDRGHMTPNADRDHQDRLPINQETFLMTNMVPQAPDNNQGPWADFENYLRNTLTDDDNELYIVSGPAGVGGVGDSGPRSTIAGGRVTVPAWTWKVVLVLPSGENDINRVSAAARTIAIKMPNVNGIFSDDWQKYLTSVDEIETLTSYDFFENVPDAIENSIEAGIDGVNPPGTGNQQEQTSEDNAVQFALNAVDPNGAILTATWSQPTNGSVSCEGINCTYTPVANFNGTDSFTFSVSNGSKMSNTSTATITVNSVNDLPTVSNDQNTAYPGVQYSDPIHAITVTASDLETAAGGLTPSYAFSKNGGAAQSGLPAGLSLVQTAVAGTWTLSGDIGEPTGTYTINITFTDADRGSGSTTVNIDVSREDSSVDVSGAEAVQVATAGGKSPSFTISADITETRDGAQGNIATAVPVTFVLAPVGGGSPYTCAAPTITVSSGTLNAACNFSNVDVNVYDVSVTVGGDYYQGAGRSVVTVYDPSLGFVTGGGTITRTVNGETFKANFGANVKYLRNGNTQGSLLYIEHRASGNVILKSNAMGALAIVGNEAKPSGKATLNGVGNHSFIARLIDMDELASGDRFGIRVTDPSGVVLADLTFDPVNLSGGNVKVPQNTR